MMQFVSLALALALIGCQRNGTTTEEKSGAAAGEKAGAGEADVAAKVAATPSHELPKAPPPPPQPEGAPPAFVAPDGVWRTSPLGRDVERVCNVLTYAGVADKTPNEQLNAILEWLPQNIESEDGRNFLGSIAELQGDAKADALDAAAKRVGLVSGCPLAASWRQPPAQ